MRHALELSLWCDYCRHDAQFMSPRTQLVLIHHQPVASGVPKWSSASFSPPSSSADLAAHFSINTQPWAPFSPRNTGSGCDAEPRGRNQSWLLGQCLLLPFPDVFGVPKPLWMIPINNSAFSQKAGVKKILLAHTTFAALFHGRSKQPPYLGYPH